MELCISLISAMSIHCVSLELVTQGLLVRIGIGELSGGGTGEIYLNVHMGLTNVIGCGNIDDV